MNDDPFAEDENIRGGWLSILLRRAHADGDIGRAIILTNTIAAARATRMLRRSDVRLQRLPPIEEFDYGDPRPVR